MICSIARSAESCDERSSSTLISVMASSPARRVFSMSSCAVVFGTWEPAMIKPPVSRGEGRPSSFPVMGGLERIPRRVDTNAAPVRERKCFPFASAVQS